MQGSNACDYKILYEKYVGEMYAYGIALGINEDLLYDLIHDVFLHFFEHQNEVVENEHVKYYLFRCLKNKLISLKRKEINWNELSQTEELPFFITITGVDLIEEKELQMEITGQINKMMQCLTDRQREAVYLRFMQELSYEEIADLLGLTVKGTRKLVYRSLERIREQFGPGLIFFFLLEHFFYSDGVI